MKPLTKAEEVAYFHLCRLGNRKARDVLINRNMGFVYTTAKKYKSSSMSRTDLIHEGVLGLDRAIETFNVERGWRFITYATWWIRAYMSAAIRDHMSLIRLPAHHRLAVQKELKKDLTENSHIPNEIKALIQISQKGIPFDKPLNNGTSKMTYAEILPDDSVESPDTYTDKKELYVVVDEMLKVLNPREKEALSYLCGMGNNDVLSLKKTSVKMGISKTRVKQYRDQAIRKIRPTIDKEKLKEIFESCK